MKVTVSLLMLFWLGIFINNSVFSKDYFKTIERKFDEKDYEGVIKEMTKAIELDSNMENAYLWRGRCFYKLGKFDSALKDFDMSIKLNKYAPWNFYLRGLTKSEMSEYYSALFDFDRAIELEPNFKEAYQYRCKARFEVEAYEGAINDASIAISINKYDGRSYYHRGVCYYFGGNYKAALDDLNHAEKYKHPQPYIYYYRGLVKFNLNDTTTGLEDFTKAVEMSSEHSKSLKELSQFYYNRSDYPKAFEYIDDAIERDSTKYIYHHQRGLINLKMKKYQEAISDFDKSILIDTNFTESLVLRASIKYDLGVC